MNPTFFNMFSVENFYYILHRQLLKPLRIPAWYCKPFGSTNLVTLNNYKTLGPELLEIVFWDQEPFNHSMYATAIKAKEQSNQMRLTPNAVAVSDKCVETQSLPNNWYYFFHGFAALDWYRDAQYIPLLNNNFSKVFITMNRLVTIERSYRLALCADLIERGLHDFGNISCFRSDQYGGTWQDEIYDVKTKLSTVQISRIDRVFSKFENDIILDKVDVPSYSSASFSNNEYNLFQDSFVHLVTETVYYQKKLHLTEKIFRPIVVGRPFILAGAVGNLEYLRSYGFKTFNDFWDESYDSIEDNEVRLTKVVDIISQLCSLSQSELQDMYTAMFPILEYNHKHFYNEFKENIVTELVNNFTSMVETYNTKTSKPRYDLNNLDNANVIRNLLL